MCSFSVSLRFWGFSKNGDVSVGSLLVVFVPACGVVSTSPPFFLSRPPVRSFLRGFLCYGELGKQKLRAPPIATSVFAFSGLETVFHMFSSYRFPGRSFLFEIRFCFVAMGRFPLVTVLAGGSFVFVLCFF